MEGGGENVVLANQDREAVATGEDLDARTGGDDARGADEDSFEGYGVRAEIAGGVEVEIQGEDGGVSLISVGVAFDDDIDGGEAVLGGVADFAGQKDGSGAGAEDWFLGGEGAEVFEKAAAMEELEHGGGFATGEDEGVDLCEGFSSLYERRDRSDFGESGGVRFIVALEGEDADTRLVWGQWGLHLPA